MTRSASYLVFLCSAISLGGLLFGYDTAVIAGAIGSLSKHFSLTPALTGWAVSSALVGCVVGANIVGWIASSYGRRVGLILAAVLFFVSALFSAVASTFTILVIARIVGGIGIGIASTLVPIYVSELAPPEKRGLLTTLNAIAVTGGIVIVYVVNYLIFIHGSSEWNLVRGWRWMFGSEIVPAVLFLFLLFFVPRSPRWLFLRGQEEKARAIFSHLYADPAETERALSELRHYDSQSEGKKVSLLKWCSSHGKVVLMALFLVFLQQASGINAILYYATQILSGFHIGGGGAHAAYAQSIAIGLVNFLATFIALFTVDRWGRRPLLILGSLGCFISMSSAGILIFMRNSSLWLLAAILLYIVFFAFTLGPIIWTYITEIFPNAVRAKAMSLAVEVLWISNILVSQTFPMLNGSKALKSSFHGSFPFLVYGVVALLGLIIITASLRETKGRSLEQLEVLYD